MAYTRKMELDLKEYIEEMNSRGSGGYSTHKYNNLKISFDMSKSSRPHFVVAIGISSAMFSMETGEKISGGLSGEEKYIPRWLARGSVKSELEAMWREEVRDNKTVRFD